MYERLYVMRCFVSDLRAIIKNTFTINHSKMFGIGAEIKKNHQNAVFLVVYSGGVRGI